MRDLSKILIIDDSTTLCLLMTQMLRKAGYQVITAENGREGLKKIQSEKPQCLILDVVLPDMSGFEVCRKLRANDPQHVFPIIMASSKSTSVDQYWGLRQGATKYLVKPFTEEELLNIVKELVPVYATGSHKVVEERPVKPQFMPQMNKRTRLAQLIPRRIVSTDSRQPNRSNGVFISDKEARLVYSVIDGRKDVENLCFVTGLAMEDISRALHMLLSLQHIQLCEQGGRVVESPQFFTRF